MRYHTHQMKPSLVRAGLPVGLLLASVLALVGCASRPPEVKPEPKPAVVVPPAPRISLKPYHRSMLSEMQKSFDKADEILIGVYTGTYADGPKGRSQYFDQVRTFDKETWTWGQEMNVLLPILFADVRPEIITSREFKTLSALDKTGICWDDYEGPRRLYLVEGMPTLLFLKLVFDESAASSRRILVDTYPITKDCRAGDVFDSMLRERAARQ
jgi:hypothetical protein